MNKVKRLLAVPLVAVLMTAAYITPAHAADAADIIVAKTGSSASPTTTTQTLGDFTLGAGRAKGEVLDSYVQRTSDSVRMLSTITSSSQSTVTYAFNVPRGAEVKSMPDGGLVVLRELVGPGRTVEVLGTVSAPWAVDANGVSRRTAYTYANGTISQSVDTAGAAFPIVADPTLTYGLGVYLNMWGYELKNIASALVSVVGGGIIWTCANTSRLPVVIRQLVGILCLVVGAPSILQIFNAIISFWRGNLIYTYSCYQKQIVPNYGTYHIVTAYRNCYW